MPQAQNTEALDEHLKAVIQALHGPKLVDNAIRDCKEILDVVIEGNVSEWLH